MMNLSINLTLGSPGAESVLNTAPAPEDSGLDSFSLKLADELSEQELTPPIQVEDTRAVDPALLEAIAARQKLAADSEAASAKDGRVWLDDPLAGLPAAAENEAELTEAVTEDKPWFDIIEKAKSYGPALQANKPSGDVSPDAAQSADQVVTADITYTGTQSSSADALHAALTAATASEATVAQSTTDTGSAATDMTAVDSIAADQAGQTTSLATEQLSRNSAETDLTAIDVTEQNQAGVTASAPASTTADDKVGKDTQPAPTATMSSVATEAAAIQNKSTTKSAQLQTEQSTATKTTSKTVDALDPDDASMDAESGAVVSAGAVPESQAEQVAKQAQQSGLTQQPAKATTQQSAVALHESAVTPEQTEPELPAAMMVQAQAAPANTNRATTAAASLEKAPAANAFAEHLKTVNQTQQQQQQQQQQAGAEQQPGQGQAKASADVMLANQPVQPATTTLAFGQQLQQLQQAQPLTEHTAGATALTQPVTHSAGTAHTPLMASRAAETTSWQAPLALTEPAAAQQLKDRVMVQIQHKLQTAEVQLHPEDLGSMQIKLNLQQDQLSVQFVVQQGAAKEALEQQMPKLRELLEQQGIALTEGQVEQRQSGGQQEQRQARSGSSGGSEADLAAAQTVQIKVSDRMVDFYA